MSGKAAIHDSHELATTLETRANNLLALAESEFFGIGPNPFSEGRAEDARLMRAASAALMATREGRHESGEVERVIASLQNHRLSTMEGRGTAMVAMASAVTLIQRLDAALRAIETTVKDARK